MLNLLEQGAAERLVPKARERGVAGIARETLANGLLIKSEAEIDFEKYTSSPEQRALRREQLARYRTQAAGENRSLARLALGYVRDVEGVAVSLIGASTVPQLRALLKELPS
jgi:aryl-alcohol dehydrogenase-like predicted oxidoreductase